MKRLRVIVDDAIPYIKGVLEPYAEVFYCKGGEFASLEENRGGRGDVPSCGGHSYDDRISCDRNSCDMISCDRISDDKTFSGRIPCESSRVIDSADALIIRTRTRCDAGLLEGTSVKFIATATIGTDHIDMEYCAAKGITVTSAPGCNSGAVMQYVFTALYALSAKKNGGRFRSVVYDETASPRRKRVLGVVGVGHVGGKVAALGEALGFEVLMNDPPKETLQEELIANGVLRREEAVRYCPLDELLGRSDIVTLHVPLIEKSGRTAEATSEMAAETAAETATYGMAGTEFFAKMKAGAVFINSCRGQVVNDEALVGASGLSGVIIDVWNGEPEISPELLARADIATPHIAGYSVEGKINGTVAAVRDFARFFDIPSLADFSLDDKKSTQHIHVDDISESDAARAMLSGFPIMELDRRLRDNPWEFEKIRSGYRLRNEFEWRK